MDFLPGKVDPTSKISYNGKITNARIPMLVTWKNGSNLITLFIKSEIIIEQ